MINGNFYNDGGIYRNENRVMLFLNLNDKFIIAHVTYSTIRNLITKNTFVCTRYLHIAYIIPIGFYCTYVSTTIRVIFGIVCRRKYTYCVVVMRSSCENLNYADRHITTANSKTFDKGEFYF